MARTVFCFLGTHTGISVLYVFFSLSHDYPHPFILHTLKCSKENSQEYLCINFVLAFNYSSTASEKIWKHFGIFAFQCTYTQTQRERERKQKTINKQQATKLLLLFAFAYLIWANEHSIIHTEWTESFAKQKCQNFKSRNIRWRYIRHLDRY